MKNGYYFSETLNERVYLHKVERTSDIPYDCCERCGKLLTRCFYEVTGENECCALYGSECVKSLKLRKIKE